MLPFKIGKYWALVFGLPVRMLAFPISVPGFST